MFFKWSNGAVRHISWWKYRRNLCDALGCVEVVSWHSRNIAEVAIAVKLRGNAIACGCPKHLKFQWQDQNQTLQFHRAWNSWLCINWRLGSHWHPKEVEESKIHHTMLASNLQPSTYHTRVAAGLQHIWSAALWTMQGFHCDQLWLAGAMNVGKAKLTNDCLKYSANTVFCSLKKSEPEGTPTGNFCNAHNRGANKKLWEKVAECIHWHVLAAPMMKKQPNMFNVLYSKIQSSSNQSWGWHRADASHTAKNCFPRPCQGLSSYIVPLQHTTCNLQCKQRYVTFHLKMQVSTLKMQACIYTAFKMHDMWRSWPTNTFQRDWQGFSKPSTPGTTAVGKGNTCEETKGLSKLNMRSITVGGFFCF